MRVIWQAVITEDQWADLDGEALLRLSDRLDEIWEELKEDTFGDSAWQPTTQ